MHKFASFNHEILPASEPEINASSSAALYGRGIFTTIAIYNSNTFLWEKHWRRLNFNAKKIGLDLSEFNEQKVHYALSEITKTNEIINGRCRITFFDESSSKIWKSNSIDKTSLLIQTADLRKRKQNISLTVSPFTINSKSPLAGVKSCNYLENILAIEDAKSRGFVEAVRLNESGKITSACMANIFWIKGKKIFTPGLKTGCLAGTTREFVLENQRVCEVEENLDSLKVADAIFLASTGVGLCQSSINNQSIDSNLILNKLKQKLLEKQQNLLKPD